MIFESALAMAAIMSCAISEALRNRRKFSYLPARNGSQR